LRDVLVVVEAPLKALALTAAGLNAVGLGGVATTLDGDKLNASWEPLSVRGRDVRVLFDANRATNENVQAAERRLVSALEQAGARVRVCSLPPTEAGEDQGPDDYFAQHGAEALYDVVRRAEAPPALVRLLTAEEFFAEEPESSLVVPDLGICAGPPLGLVGQLYTGKTIAALSFGLSVALGRSLWGLWSVQQGPWLHLDHEQGKRHTKARIRRLAHGFGVSDEEVRHLIGTKQIRVCVFPELNLTTQGAIDHYKKAFEGVRLVTCDSLRPMLGGVDENSSQVRSLLNQLSVASDATAAAVAMILHGGKTPLEGSRPRKETARGSSGILDELQSMLVMTKAKGDPWALVTHEKDRELGMTVSDFGLRILDIPSEGDPKWGLRVEHVDRDQMKDGGESASAAFAKVKEKVLHCIRDNPGVAGTEAVRELVGGSMNAIRAAVATLIADGVVVERTVPGKGKGRRLYLKHAAPPGEA
jgi:hypothetical protein